MDSCHGNPSPSDPMESVCRHFPPPPQLHFAVYLLSLSRTVFRWVWLLMAFFHRTQFGCIGQPSTLRPSPQTPAQPSHTFLSRIWPITFYLLYSGSLTLTTCAFSETTCRAVRSARVVVLSGLRTCVCILRKMISSEWKLSLLNKFRTTFWGRF